MTMTDPEWHGLMEAWQSEAPEEAAPAPLSGEVRRRIRRKVRLHSYGLILLAVFEVTGCAGVLVWLFRDLLEDGPNAVEIAGFAGTAFFVAVALAFTFWNRRGAWWPAAESTRAFVDLSLDRCHRKLRTLRFCPWLLAAELAFVFPWGAWAIYARPELGAKEGILMFGWTALASAALLVWWAWYKRKTLREMAEWQELRRSLGD
jgi:hypothetical protein